MGNDADLRGAAGPAWPPPRTREAGPRAAPAREVALSAGALEVGIRAGALLEVHTLRHLGEELLVSAAELPPATAIHGRAGGIVLLHPWANRLAGHAYVVGGRAVTIDPDDPSVARDDGGLPHHGLVAPPGAWRLDREAPERAVARLTHAGAAGSAFPFPHELTVCLVLRLGRLEIATTLRPTGDVAVPVAFGWHPFLRLPGVSRAAWRVALPARRHLGLGTSGLPDGTVQQNLADELLLDTRALDEGYRVASGAWFGLRGGGRRIRVRLLDGFPAAQVFAPSSMDLIALEPMTAPINALVTGNDLRLVEPGGTFTATFAVDARTHRSADEAPGYPSAR